MNERHLSTYRAIGVFMIVLALVNIAATLIIFTEGGVFGALNVQPDEAGADPGTVTSDIVQDVGGLTSPMGLATLFWSIVLLVIGVNLVRGQAWEMFAVIALGIDIVLKIANIISQLVIGATVADAAVVPTVFVIVNAVAAFVILRQYQARKRGEPLAQ